VRASHWWILALATSIVVAGLVGVAAHTTPAHRPAGTTSRPPSTNRSTTTRPPPTTAPEPAGASSAVLAANLLTPTDLGGFYTPDPEAAAAFLDSAPCLAGLLPAPSQSGRAVTGLVVVSNLGQVPDVTEVVLSYPGSTAAAVYRSLTATMADCLLFAVSLDGTQLRISLGAGSMPAVGDASSLYQGQFQLDGLTEQLGLAFVLDGQEVFAVAFLGRVPVPPSDAIMGDLPSTVSAAIGKEA
jgi:hypothetical protein